MKTISLIKTFSLVTLLLFASCKNDDQEEPGDVSCELSFESVLIENDSENEADYIFTANELNSESDVRYSWTIDGETTDESSNVLDYVFIENGTYTVCVFSETPECPQGVEYCQEIVVDSLPEKNDTCFDITFETLIQNSGYRFEASGHDASVTANYVWSVDGEFIDGDVFDGTNKEYFSHDFTENGTYTVCVFIETPECPQGVEYCEDIIVTNVNDGTTAAFDITVTDGVQDKSLDTCADLTYNYTQKENNVFTLEVDNAEEIGGGFSWFINGDYIGSGATIDYEFVDASTYTICVSQETPECPNTVSFCRDFNVTYITMN